MTTRSRLRFVTSALVAVVLVACTAAGAEAPSTIPPLQSTEEPTEESTTTTSTTSTSTTTSTTSTTTSSTSTSSTSTTTSTTITTLPPTTTQPPPEIATLEAALVAVGARNGFETARVQERLLNAGFWLMAIDGQYGLTTRQAVMAFQKYHGLKATGSVDAATARILTDVSERPRSRSERDGDVRNGVLVEVDKDRQIVMILVSGRVEWVINTSTGTGQWYLETNQNDSTKWEIGQSITRSGRFKVNRQRAEGWWAGDLGEIYRPKYFSGGIAIHGSRSIPNYPASRGCVRVSVPAMDMIWASGLIPMGTAVWVYGADPETKNAKPEIPTTTTLPPEPPAESPDTNASLPLTTSAP